MRTVRNITVAVEPELYRQTRRIAADCDTTLNRHGEVSDPGPARSGEGRALPRRAGGKFAWQPLALPRRCFGPARRHVPEPVQSLPEKKRNLALYACKCQ